MSKNPFNRSNLSLKAQLTLAMVGIVALSSLVLSFFAYQTATEVITHEALRVVSTVATSREHLLVETLQNRKERWNSLLQLIFDKCGKKVSSDHKSCVETLIKNHMAISDATAAVLESPYYRLEVGTRKNENWSLPGPGEIARFQTQGSVVTFVTLNESKDKTWKLLAEFSDKEIRKIFKERFGLGESGETFLVNAKGLFLTPSRYKSPAGHSHPITARPMIKCLGGGNGEVLDPDYRGVPVIHGYRNVQEAGGACIMAHIDQSEAFAPSRKLLEVISIFVILLMILAAVLAYILSKFFTMPIVELAGVAKKLQQGEFDIEIPTRGPEEVRTFALTFQSMVHTLTSDIRLRQENERKLEEALRAREEFLSVASHELKTPLTSIKLQTQLTKRKVLKDPKAPDFIDKINKFVGLIDKQVERLSRLVDDMLDISKFTTGKLTIHKDHFDMNDLVTEVTERLAPSFAQNNTSITVNSFGPAVGNWDRFRMDQVIANLLINALKYGARRPVVVEVRKKDSDVYIIVRDEGKGIPKEDQNRIFERFERATSPNEASGLGLGLYIVQKIVEMHGGSVSVESKMGVGSNFIVRLPESL